MIHRRKFLIGLGSLMAAPAIVHAGNLMPVKAMKDSVEIMRDWIDESYFIRYGHYPWYVGINQRAKYRWVAIPENVVWPA